jgi:hypothetical protein
MIETIKVYCWKCGKSFYIPSNLISLHDKLCTECGGDIDKVFEKYKDINVYTMYKLYKGGAFSNDNSS